MLINRRDFVKVSALSFLSIGAASCGYNVLRKNDITASNYDTVLPNFTDRIELPKNYRYQILASYGDNIFGGENFDLTNPLKLSNNIKQCFGYNNDFCAYFPIEGSSEHGILCVNHEYVNPELMFSKDFLENNNFDATSISLDSLGCSIIEIKKIKNNWQIVKSRQFNNRITQRTICKISGAVYDSPRIVTRYSDPNFVMGTLANCGGGKTPWNTYLTAEENFDKFFGGDFSDSLEARNHSQIGFKSESLYQAEKYFSRFNLAKNPNEPNKFGYIVEIDPFDPKKIPVKRSSLGRFKHETATTYLDPSGHVVIYMGDDEDFEHLYKYVSKNKFDPQNSNNNNSLLDEGTLMVAKFFDDKTLQWLPLNFGENGLDKSNNFFNQADVIIETRRAAKILGATKLDRPEGIAIHPQNGKIYVSLTNNHQRTESDMVSEDVPNIHGYILEIDPNSHHLNSVNTWQIVLHGSTSRSKSLISNPDNLIFDNDGNLWVATDGMPKSRKVSDSLFKINLESRRSRRLLNTPHGSEVTGPEFTPDQKNLFLSIQHPGEGSDFNSPSTLWPKFKSGIPPLPSVIVITKNEGSL